VAGTDGSAGASAVAGDSLPTDSSQVDVFPDLPLVKGSGNVVTEPRQVTGFSSVTFRGSAKLFIDQTGAESLTIEAEDNLLPYLISEVSGDRLILGVRPGCSIQPTQQITFRLTVKQLRDISARGSGEIDAKGLATDVLNIEQSGSFDVTAAGRAARLELDVSGSGRYRGENLDSKEADIEVSGSGAVVVRVSERLNAEVTGSGSVEYIGSPAVTQTVRGSGSIQKR